MFCPNCGKELCLGDKVCVSCQCQVPEISAAEVSRQAPLFSAADSFKNSNIRPGLFFAIATIIVIAAIVTGGILGNAIPVIEGVYYPRESYNFGLAFTIWISGILCSLIFFGIGKVLKNQELIYRKICESLNK